MARRPPSPRTERRARERAHGALVRDLERLAALAEGGSAGRPLVVDTPALVDVIARRTPCPLCEGSLQLDEHAAAVVDGEPLRLARVRCVACGVPRVLYFRLGAHPN